MKVKYLVRKVTNNNLMANRLKNISYRRIKQEIFLKNRNKKILSQELILQIVLKIVNIQMRHQIFPLIKIINHRLNIKVKITQLDLLIKAFN